MASIRGHARILDTAKRKRPKTGCVDDDAGRRAGVAQMLGLADVREDAAFRYDAILQTLAHQPRKMQGCVDAKAVKGAAGVEAFGNFVGVELAIVGE